MQQNKNKTRMLKHGTNMDQRQEKLPVWMALMLAALATMFFGVSVGWLSAFDSACSKPPWSGGGGECVRRAYPLFRCGPCRTDHIPEDGRDASAPPPQTTSFTCGPCRSLCPCIAWQALSGAGGVNGSSTAGNLSFLRETLLRSSGNETVDMYVG